MCDPKSIFFAGDQGSKRRRFSAHSGNSNVLNFVNQAESHSRLARFHWPAISKEDRIKEPKYEVATKPATAISPLEWPDLLIPPDPIPSRAIPQ
jgi:hypothetical protein